MVKTAIRWMILIGCIFCSLAFAECREYQYKETKDVLKWINEASELVKVNGTASFSGLEALGKKYGLTAPSFFIWDDQGQQVFPKFEATQKIPPILGQHDLDGKDIVKQILEYFAMDPSAEDNWFFYRIQLNQEVTGTWVNLYIKEVKTLTGATYYVGMSRLNLEIEKCFIVDKVNEARLLLAKEGHEGFDKINSRSSPFYFLGTYVFVDTMEGFEVANAGFANMINVSFWNIIDPKTGHYMLRDMVDVIRTKGHGWITYYCPRPEDNLFQKKTSYVRGVNIKGEMFIVGAGIYVKEDDKGKP